MLLYNFCAFALQMPLGLVLDRVGNGKAFAALGCLVVAASLAFRGNAPAVCLVAGIGNALFRIGGRHDVLRRCGRRAAWLGAFVSPGTFGLFLGGLLGGGSCPVWPVPTALALTAAGILCLCPPVAGASQAPLADAGARPWLIGFVLLFLVVCLRSRREALKDDLRFVMSTGSACRSLRTVRFPAPRPAIPKTRSRPPRPKGLAPRRPYAFASKQRPLGMGATSVSLIPAGLLSAS